VANDRLSDQMGRPVTDEELAAELGLSLEQVRRAKDIARVVASLEQPVGEEDAVLGDFLGADETPSAEEAALDELSRSELHRAVDELPPLERDVVRARFGLDDGVASNVAATARRLGVSERRVRRLEASALASRRVDLERRVRREEWIRIRQALAEAEVTNPFPSEGMALTAILVVADIERAARWYEAVLGGVPVPPIRREVGGVPVPRRMAVARDGRGATEDKPTVTFAARWTA
jgi:hypothetical protein